MLLSVTVMAREKWTDERLDDLATGIDKRFDRVDADIRELRLDINGVRADMKKGFERVDDRFDSMQRTIVIGFVTLFASIVASVIGAVLAALLLV